jgi:dUTP pyrophosphatase
MHIVKIHPGIITPKRGTDFAAGYDIFMPEAGIAYANQVTKVPLGIKVAIPDGWCGLLLPRSGTGAKTGLELNNTCGVIDSDYRGEVYAFIKLKTIEELKWDRNDRLLQLVVVPHLMTPVLVVDELPPSGRGTGGFGSTGV